MRARFVRFALAFVALVALVSAGGVVRGDGPAVSVEDLKARIQEATKGFADVKMVGTVVFKDKKALAKVDPSFAQLYDFKSADISLKMPDKIRMDSKLGMVNVEYIVNGTKKVVRAGPVPKVNRVKDYPNDPAKLQDALDVGLVTADLWRNRRVTVVEDAEADANGEIKLKLCWAKGTPAGYAWIDAKDLWLKKFEKRDGADKLQLRIVYSDPAKCGDVIWIPRKLEMFAWDGAKAGASEYSEIKVNTGIPDTLFE